MGFKLDTNDMERHSVELRLYVEKAKRRFAQAEMGDVFEKIIRNQLPKLENGEGQQQEEAIIKISNINLEEIRKLNDFLDTVINRCSRPEQHESIQHILRASLLSSRKKGIVDPTNPSNVKEPFCYFCGGTDNGKCDRNNNNTNHFVQDDTIDENNKLVIDEAPREIDIVPANKPDQEFVTPEMTSDNGSPEIPMTQYDNLNFNNVEHNYHMNNNETSTNAVDEQPAPMTPPISTGAPTPDFVNCALAKQKLVEFMPEKDQIEPFNLSITTKTKNKNKNNDIDKSGDVDLPTSVNEIMKTNESIRLENLSKLGLKKRQSLSSTTITIIPNASQSNDLRAEFKPKRAKKDLTETAAPVVVIKNKSPNKLQRIQKKLKQKEILYQPTIKCVQSSSKTTGEGVCVGEPISQVDDGHEDSLHDIFENNDDNHPRSSTPVPEVEDSKKEKEKEKPKLRFRTTKRRSDISKSFASTQ